MSPWIPDTGFCWGSETKYLKTVDLYWHVKTVNACTIEENGSQRNDILRKLDQLDQKYENLTNAIWR